jgi:hypothetical protein
MKQEALRATELLKKTSPKIVASYQNKRNPNDQKLSKSLG